MYPLTDFSPRKNEILKKHTSSAALVPFRYQGELRMAKKQFYKRQRNPIILLVCEGKNKTERKYFSHYQVRESHYRLAIKDSEATDVMGMARHAANLYKEYQMDPAIGDLAFCLIDLDLRRDKYDAYLKAKQKYPQVRFIVSNPCFEIWLLYYFTENPKAESSSQAVKEQMKKYVPGYNEAMDAMINAIWRTSTQLP